MDKCTLKNGNLSVTILSLGAIVHELWIPNKNNQPINVIVGLANVEAYQADTWYRGATIGPYAGRLSNPVLIGEKQHTLHQAEASPLLHGGSKSWAKKHWRLNQLNATTLEAHLHCKEEENVFPGAITIVLRYQLLANGLELHYEATTTAPTPLNLTNHAYFNLEGTASVAHHELQIHAEHYLALDKNLIPTGKFCAVEQSPFDFRGIRTLDNTSLDTYYVTANKPTVARCYAPSSGIEMEVRSDQFGIVVFRPPHFEALCFESQAPSDATKWEHFPNTIFTPNRPYKQVTQWLFRVR